MLLRTIDQTVSPATTHNWILRAICGLVEVEAWLIRYVTGILEEMGKQFRRKPKNKHRLSVDAAKLNMGNTYSSPPEYYYDFEFTCVDCGIEQTWTAKQQKWWYEEAGGYFFAGAIRCRICRQKERERKNEARKSHLEGLQKKGAHKQSLKDGTA